MTDELPAVRFIWRDGDGDGDGRSTLSLDECVRDARLSVEEYDGEGVIYRMTPIARVTRKTVVEWLDPSQAEKPAPSEFDVEPAPAGTFEPQAPWYPDDGPWEELTDTVRERLRTETGARYKYITAQERAARSLIYSSWAWGYTLGDFLPLRVDLQPIAIKRVQP